MESSRTTIKDEATFRDNAQLLELLNNSIAWGLVERSGIKFCGGVVKLGIAQVLKWRLLEERFTES